MLETSSDGAWPFWLGGLALGSFAVALAWVTGKALGVSSAFGTACSLLSGAPVFRRKPFADRWRLTFVAGIPLGGLAAAWLAGELAPRSELMPLTGTRVPVVLVLALGGFLVGYGARLTGG